MTKRDLILITLKQLKESLKVSPECFKLEDREVSQNYTHAGPSILWRFQVEIDGARYPDPNNASRTIIVSYNSINKQLSAYIFFRDVSSVSSAIVSDASATIQLSDMFYWLDKSYREFMSLRELLLKQYKEKENIEYLKKLSSVFPTTFDDHLLK